MFFISVVAVRLSVVFCALFVVFFLCSLLSFSHSITLRQRLFCFHPCVYTMTCTARNNMLVPRASYQYWEDKALSSSIARVLLSIGGDVRSLACFALLRLLLSWSSSQSLLWPCERTTTTLIYCESTHCMQFPVHAFPSLTHFLVLLSINLLSPIEAECGHNKLLIRALCSLYSAWVSFSSFLFGVWLLLSHSICVCSPVCECCCDLRTPIVALVLLHAFVVIRRYFGLVSMALTCKRHISCVCFYA